MTIQGYHRKSADEFGQGVSVVQAFAASGFAAVDVQFSTDRPLNLLLRCELMPVDEPNDAKRGRQAAPHFVTLKRVSGVEWRRLSFAGEEESSRRWYLLRLDLIRAVPAGDDVRSVPDTTSDDRRDRVGVIVSRDNVFGGGALWIGDHRQIGSLSLRAFSRRTAFERFRADVAPTLPPALRSASIEAAIAVAYLCALATVVYALLIGDPRGGVGASSD